MKIRQSFYLLSRGDFKMLGHAIRDVTVSRGNKEGDNAFLLPERDIDHQSGSEIIQFILKHNLPLEFIQKLIKNDKSEVCI